MKQGLLRHLWVFLSACAIGCYASLINRFRAIGVEHIPRAPGRGVMLAANHTSAYDTVFLPWVVIRRFPRRMIWAPAKQELFRNRFVGWVIHSWGAFPVNRGRDFRAWWLIATLLKTETVMLFPEGTRHADGTLGEGNRAVGKLIYDTRPIVVPCAISGLGSWRFSGSGQRGQVVFGPAVDFSDLYQGEKSKETYNLIVNRVMAAISGLLATDPQR